MQRNLEQLRALHAHRFWDATWEKKPGEAKQRLKDVQGSEGGEVVAKLGPLILECGLLATVAFAQQKGHGYETLLTEVGRFLGSTGDDGRRLLPTLAGKPVETLTQFVSVLTTNDSTLLRLATAEALRYVGYLKRLAPPTPPAPNSVPALPNPLPV